MKCGIFTVLKSNKVSSRKTTLSLHRKYAVSKLINSKFKWQNTCLFKKQQQVSIEFIS